MAVLSPKLNLPIADYERPWDGRIARARVLDWCKKKIQAGPTDKEIDAECASQAFMLRRDGEPDYTREAWDLPYADVVEGRLMIVPRGVKALASGHGVQAVQDVSEGEQERMRKHVCALYERVRKTYTQMPPCPFAKGSKVTRPISGSLTAAGIADPSRSWDGSGAQTRIIAHCEGKQDSCWKQAYLVPGATPSESKFPVMDVIDGDLQIVPRAVIAAAGRSGQAKGVDASALKGKICSLYGQIKSKYSDFPDCPLEKDSTTGGLVAANPFAEGYSDGDAPSDGAPPEMDRAEIKAKICKLYDQLEQECPFAEDEKPESEETAAATPGCNCGAETHQAAPAQMYASASGNYSRTAAGIPVIGRKAPVKPPLEWFASPEFPLDAPMPLTIQADGRIQGHGALWDSCHAGFADRCIPVPHSAQDYKFFHRGAVETDDGVLVAVGHLTVGGGHADEDGNLRAASEHYDNAGTTVAVVSAHEDRWGVYLAGSLVPEATPEQIALLRRSPLSGDWRAFNGNLELVAMHGVNVPGFGVDRPRVAVAASGVLIFPGPLAPEPVKPNSIKKENVFTMEEIDSRISLAASALLSKPAV